MKVTIELLVFGLALLVVLAAVAWTHARNQAALARVDDRMSHLLAGVSLLTDTMEGGLRDVAVEMGRMAGAQAAPRKPKATAQRRVTTAARRGRSVQEIAASEDVSEGEVRLRLNMDRSQKERAHHAALR